MQAWRWGCRVVSATSGAVCWIDWPRPEDSEEYVFPLDVWFSGPHDRPFEHHIRERVQQYLEHPRYREDHGFAEEWEEIPSGELAKHGFPGRQPDESEEARRFDVQYSRRDAVGIRVTFSFAGSDQKEEENKRIGDIPSLLGRKLKELFAKEKRGEVLCYDLFEGEERLSTFIEYLAQGDLALCR